MIRKLDDIKNKVCSVYIDVKNTLRSGFSDIEIRTLNSFEIER
jgi:hypothetical protein